MKLASVAVLLFTTVAAGQVLHVNWDNVERTSKTTATLQVVVNPLLRRGSAIHDRAFAELRRLEADYVRYVPWLPYPKLAVAELEPPPLVKTEKTHWDFSLIDPMTTDFLNATAGHSVMLNFSTIPQWMFKTEKPVSYPTNPDEPTWTYTQGTELRDATLQELADYYARLVGWYVNSGFTDELGRWHESGHRFKIDYWEVLNEPDLEHETQPAQYAARYDAIVSAVRRISPGTKFVGLSLAFPANNPEMFEYFLNHANHKPGIPLDMISYHFYAVSVTGEPLEAQQYSFFAQADGFLGTVKYIESIRRRLSPDTRTAINELGCIRIEDAVEQGKPGYVMKPIPDSYWNLCGAVYAYAFANLVYEGIDVVGASQLVGYPTQFPSVSLLDWNTGAPNARFRVLELLENNLRPGDRIMKATGTGPHIFALGILGADGQRKLLLVNKRGRDVELTLPGRAGAVAYVDQTTNGAEPAQHPVNSDQLTLRAFGVAIVTMNAQ